MLNKLNKFLYSSIIISALMLLIGVTFVIYPEISFATITYILAIVLVINGIYFLIEKENSIFFSSLFTLGIIEILFGLVILLNPDIVKTLFPIVIGIIMVTKATLDLKLSMLLCKNKYDSWLYIFICSIISITCGVIIILNPNIGTIALTTFIGIVITIYALSNIVDTFLFKKDINNIIKLLEKK